MTLLKTFSLVLIPLMLVLFSFCSSTHTAQRASTTESTALYGDTVHDIADSILVVFQDSRNNYWFGSNGKGVYRYDGKTLLHFTTHNGLCGNQIREIKEDARGNLYFNTWNGISTFDGTAFKTLPVTESSEWKLQPGDVWFSCGQNENGPYRYDGKQLYHLKFPEHYLADEFYARMPNPPYNPYQVYTSYADRKGNIWFGTSTFGACRYDGKSLSWLYEKQLTSIGENGSFGIRSIIEDKSGTFWICNTHYRYSITAGDSVVSGNNFVRYTRATGVGALKNHDENAPVYFMSVAEDSAGDLWMVTFSSGVWRYDGKTMTNYSVKKGSTTVTLFSVYKDRQGNLWLGTHTDGVYRFNGSAFEKFAF